MKIRIGESQKANEKKQRNNVKYKRTKMKTMK